MNLLFVRPQRENKLFALSLPPLGVMYIASYLRRYAPGSVNIRILDLSIERNGRTALKRALHNLKPDLIGFSALTPEAPDLAYFAGWFKHKFPDALLVAGGPHPNAAVDQTLNMEGIDLLCLGEGEVTTLELVKRLHEGKGYLDLPGLAYKENGEVRINPQADPIADLDELPFPAWDLVPLLDYCSWRVINPSVSRFYKRFTTLFTSRSCPYGCTYCHNIFGAQYRPRSAANIFAEMNELEDRYGIREFHIVDDNFNLQPERVEDLCDRIIQGKKRYCMAFVSGLRGDILTPALMDRLHSAGTYQISFGIESGSERIQKLVKRNGNIPKLMENISYARKIGIITHGFFMFGFPTETREEVAQTVRLALKADLLTAAFHTVAPFPGTPLYDQLLEKVGSEQIRLEEMYFKSSTMNLSEIPTQELHQTVKRLFRKFYFTRKRIWNIWKHSPRKIDVIVSTIFHLLLDPRLLEFKKRLTGKTHY